MAFRGISHLVCFDEKVRINGRTFHHLESSKKSQLTYIITCLHGWSKREMKKTGSYSLFYVLDVSN